ncbi:transporter substrate-binding domain-containing protein [Pelagibius marinus]|uniref:transporter substrate-binding domain-containing protein n=1 Tax=Pelagibius marinus TaxID=2762760 RepID=UPI001872DFAC|nr:transporter substrate-binding domain-containing protein [Pelagibius marinus]
MSNVDDARAELTDPSTLRVGINLGNILLVTGKSADGAPQGVAPDLAAEAARRLGVEVSYHTYPMPGELADALERDEWDIGLIAVEPKRAETIAFCDPYVEIEGSYLVPPDSPLQTIADVDQPGVRIAVANRAAYDLYLSRTLKHAELCRSTGLGGAFQLFVDEKLDALAGLKPALLENAGKVPGSRVLEGNFSTVGQAIGTKPRNTALKAFLDAFTADAKASGLVAGLIDKHGVTGKLQVAG